jgi:hypothetical protein
VNFSSLGRFPALLVIGLVIGLAGLGLNSESWSEAHGSSQQLDVRFIRAYTNDDGYVNSTSRDPNDNGIDPGYDKMVAECYAIVQSKTLVTVEIVNGYPSYTCTFWTKIRNTGDRTIRRITQVVTAPPELTVTPLYSHSCVTLKPGQYKYLGYSVHVEQSAAHMAPYQFTVENKFVKAKYECW